MRELDVCGCGCGMLIYKEDCDMKAIIGLMLKGLGPLDEYKTIIGGALVAIDAVLRYFDAGHPALAVIAAIMVGLGLGDKIGKQRAAG